MSDSGVPSKAAKLLSSIPYFADVDADTLDAVARSAICRSYQEGQIILLEGDPSSGLCVVEEGWLKAVRTSPEGREQVLHILGPGEVFNAIGVLASPTNVGTVIALEPATVWFIRREALLRLIDAHPALARIIIHSLAERVQHLITLVEDLSLRTVEARLARMLLEKATEETLHRRHWATQAEMAARLGTVPDVLNRALRSLAEKEIIRVERHQILILDRDGLASIAHLNE